MPDWFYRTVSRPALFRLSAVGARDFALGFMGRLARLPLGGAAIDFLGHMRADPRLRRSHLGVEFPTTVGVGPGLDANAVALPALARFGVGFIEVGPVAVSGNVPVKPIARLADREAIWSPDPPASLSIASAAERLAEAARLGVRLIVRVAGASADECAQVVAALAPYADLFALTGPADRLPRVITAAQAHSPPRPVLLCIAADADPTAVAAALAAGAGGVLVDGSLASDDGGRIIGLGAHEPAIRLVTALRRQIGDGPLIIASGGVHEPADALALRAAGADLVEVDTGLVFTGPGLPKRINDAALFDLTRSEPVPPIERAPEMTWFWTALMGAGMLAGSVLALAIAATRVVLPYDEGFVGLSRAELHAINRRLLAFMAHDRVSLAGTMIAIGVAYVGLSLFGVRRGLHWARQTVYVSAFTGFASFFSFLGFGYLDPFHAFVTAVLLQLLLLGVHSRLGPHTPDTAPGLHNDAAWRRSQWGQLLLIGHGFGLLGAGLMISTIGVTQVFVHEDLAFMETTAEALGSANPRLVPLVAHDRATFGGMLLSAGWVFLLPSLWGFRAGSAWLWWTFLTAGSAAYAAAIGVHFAVGYTDPMHLLPAFAGLVVLMVGLALSHGYLCAD